REFALLADRGAGDRGPLRKPALLSLARRAVRLFVRIYRAHPDVPDHEPGQPPRVLRRPSPPSWSRDEWPCADLALLTSEPEHPGQDDEQRNQDGHAVGHVSEEARHPDPALLGDGLDHEVRAVADV